MTVVSAPASSANLGPGFDVLGIALDLRVRVSTEDLGSRGDGTGPCGAEHIARIAYEQAGGTAPIWFGFDIPPGRGLGFSAAARAAGAVLGLVESGMEANAAQRGAYDIVAELEGHGDNAAPAVFGGLHVVAGDTQHHVGADFPADLLLWVPEQDTTPTDESRAQMAPTVTRADAVFNIGRVGLLMAAVYEQRPDLLRTATGDRLHQPARLAAAPASAAALEAGLAAGAIAGWLSGSGPTVAFAVDSQCADAVAEALPGGGQVLALPVDERGAVVD